MVFEHYLRRRFEREFATISEVADEFAKSPQTIYRWLRRYQIRHTALARERARMEALVYLLRARRLSLRQIERETGIRIMTVRRYVRRFEGGEWAKRCRDSQRLSWCANE